MNTAVSNYLDRMSRYADDTPSMYARVMSNPDASKAYFNTTQGILTGDPDQDEMVSVRQVLDDHSVAYLFTPDRSCPRPLFHSQDIEAIGLEEISRFAERLSSTEH